VPARTKKQKKAKTNELYESAAKQNSFYAPYYDNTSAEYKEEVANVEKVSDFNEPVIQNYCDADERPVVHGRGERMVELIETLKPDIITMQELDHYHYMLDKLRNMGFSSSRFQPRASDQSPVRYLNLKWDRLGVLSNPSQCGEKPCDKAELYEIYADALANLSSENFAFVPKLNSNAYKFRSQSVIPDTAKKCNPYIATTVMKDLDDDGSAIFYNNDKFELQTVRHFIDPAGDCGAVLTHLKRKTPQQDGSKYDLVVVTTHLASGTERTKEDERITSLKKLLPQIESFVQENMSSGPVMTVIAGDLNSDKEYGWPDAVQMSMNAHSTVVASNYSSVWDWFANGINGRSLVTVNKMRGPSSAQPTKWGEYALESIDHIFWKTRSLAAKLHHLGVGPCQAIPLSSPLQYFLQVAAKDLENGLTVEDFLQKPNGVEVSDLDALGYSMRLEMRALLAWLGPTGKELKTDKELVKEVLSHMFWRMLPNTEVPSDHCPLVADFQIAV